MNKKRDNKKRVYTVILSFLAVLFLLARVPTNERLTAHAADQKSRITKQVDKYMSAIKKYDIKKVKKMLIDKDCLHCTDKKLQKHIRRINRECLKYEITSVKVRGKSATVRLHVSQYNIQTDFKFAIREIIWEYRKTWTSDIVIKKLNKYLRESYHPESEAEHFEFNVKIKMEKRGNQWMITKMDNNTLFIKDAGLSYFTEDYPKHPHKYI